jgi:CubicO group peptidase (beta-lactamase class C family)
LLGSLLEVVSNSRFDELVDGRVLQPLGMDRTGFRYVDSNRALGHHRAGRAFGAVLRAVVRRSIGITRVGRFIRLEPFHVDGAPYGGLVGSVTDAARFLHAHISGGLLSDEGRREMQTIRHGGKPFDTGLGWFRSPRTGEAYKDAVEHLGGGAGFFNVMRLDRDTGRGIVVMGNATRYDIDKIADGLLLKAP